MSKLTFVLVIALGLVASELVDAAGRRRRGGKEHKDSKERPCASENAADDAKEGSSESESEEKPEINVKRAAKHSDAAIGGCTEGGCPTNSNSYKAYVHSRHTDNCHKRRCTQEECEEDARNRENVVVAYEWCPSGPHKGEEERLGQCWLRKKGCHAALQQSGEDICEEMLVLARFCTQISRFCHQV